MGDIVQIDVFGLKTMIVNLAKEALKEEFDKITVAPDEQLKGLVSRKDAAKTLKVSTSTLWEWDISKILIATRIGGRVFYRISDINGLLNSNKKA